ncbi:hypothetical protein Tcan_18031 [Toxocara canis]|uniref:Uncharacterized protein n=1 Tax=Toxocara canis TaxID=6265 RepID=A0A0B2VD89_TOXCA|nr:hypothetical protein Tcan_18031 [Toxocara canis]
MLDVNFSGGDSHPITRDTARSSSACCGAQSASNAYNANVEKNMRKRKKQCTENMSNAQLVIRQHDSLRKDTAVNAPIGSHLGQVVCRNPPNAIHKNLASTAGTSGAAKKEEITAARDVLCALVCVPLRCTLAALGNAGEISAEMNSICAERSRRSVKTPHLSYR